MDGVLGMVITRLMLYTASNKRQSGEFFFLLLLQNILYGKITIPPLLFVLRFYGSVNPMGSCRARSVYLTTRLLGRLSPLSG